MPVTIIFLLLFVVAQIVGLFLVNMSIEGIKKVDGQIQIAFADTVVGERPQTTGWESLLYVVVGVALGTLVLLFLAKNKKINLWKLWFLLAVWVSISLAIGALLGGITPWLPWILALGLALWKIYYQNIYIQNVTEILMYSGMAVLLVPILSLWVMVVILILFSIYDAYAVWKSKHMVTLAKFTIDANVFPGLSIPYSVSKSNKTKIHAKIGNTRVPQPPKLAKKSSKSENKTGVLGGGDVVFPLLFAGSIMLDLMKKGFSKVIAFNYSLIVVVGATLALLYLFSISKKDKFYPAMPFISTGCFLAYGVIVLLTQVL